MREHTFADLIPQSYILTQHFSVPKDTQRLERSLPTPLPTRSQCGNIRFNHGLVAIVGNKGSGKSALADTLGLLGSSKNGEAFSFLSKERFRHPNAGLAQHFDATVDWLAGDPVTKSLSDPVKPGELERLKYLPQDHVETVCNELAGIGTAGFEQELKSVIFSHVPDAERLGQATLDELVRFRTGEKQKRIDSLLRQLRESSRSRALLEAQTDPALRQKLEEEINRRKLELEAHDKIKPAEVKDPAAGGALAPDSNLLEGIRLAEGERKKLTDEVGAASDKILAAQRRQAVAIRLLEKLANFQKDFDVFRASLEEDTAELELSAEELVALTVTTTKPTAIRDQCRDEISDSTQQLDSVEPPGLRVRLASVEAKFAELQSKLDAPNRAYQAYLTALAEWQARRDKIEGTGQEPESLNGLKGKLAALEKLPVRIATIRQEQADLAYQIHCEKLAQTTVYRDLYGPVQRFINSHQLAKDKLKLEFRAELTNEDFANRFLGLLALNRKGSFMGVNEGRTKVETLLQPANWEDSNSVRQFLASVDTALHVDERPGQGGSVQLKEQLPKGSRPEEVFDLLYGLEYVQPRYVLRWEGKELSML